MSKTVHQEIVFSAPPERIYEAYMDSSKHAEFTANGAADISSESGGAFSCHGGVILGRNVDLVANRRIVQAWHVADWDEGVFSLVLLCAARRRIEYAGPPRWLQA